MQGAGSALGHAFLVVTLTTLAVNSAAATKDQYATFQPNNADDQWRVGQAVRICPTEATQGPATIQGPNTNTTVTADSEDCYAVLPRHPGTWTLTWTVPGPTTRSISFQAWGPADGPGLVQDLLPIGIAVLAVAAGVAGRQSWPFILAAGALVLAAVGAETLSPELRTITLAAGLGLAAWWYQITVGVRNA